MELSPQITDNSDVPERIISGQFTRMTLNITLKDAQLYSYEIREIPKVVSADVRASLDLKTGNNIPHSIDDDCEQMTGDILK